MLAAHEPFESVEKAVQDGSDIVSHTVLVQQVVRRKTVADTDIGKSLKESIHDLEELLAAYRAGTIRMRRTGQNKRCIRVYRQEYYCAQN